MLYPQRVVELDERSRYLVVIKTETKLSHETIERLSLQLENALIRLLDAPVKVVLSEVDLDLDFTQFKPEVNHG